MTENESTNAQPNAVEVPVKKPKKTTDVLSLRKRDRGLPAPKRTHKRLFSEAVNRRLKEMGATYVELALLAGVSVSCAYGAIKNNGKSLRIEHFEALCFALKLNPSDLWVPKGEEQSEVADAQK